MIEGPMTPERWRKIEELYHSARERGPGVLEGTDPELRREVGTSAGAGFGRQDSGPAGGADCSKSSR